MSDLKIAILTLVFFPVVLLWVGVCFHSCYGLRRKAYSLGMSLVVMVISLAIPLGLLLFADGLSKRGVIPRFPDGPSGVARVVIFMAIFSLVPGCSAAISY